MTDFRKQLNNFAKQNNIAVKDKDVPRFMEDDADYVEMAEKVMNSIYHDRRGRPGFGNLTTSKIRNVLTLVNQIYNEVVMLENKKMPLDVVDMIRYMKVRLVYEAGREPDIKSFVEKADLLKGLDCIGDDKNKFLRFARYLEALVAYRKFMAKDD